MGNAAALAAGLALAWLCLAPRPFDPVWLTGGAAALVGALGLAWRMGVIGPESAPYGRALGLVLFWLRRTPAIVAANLDLARAALAPEPPLRAGLARLRTRPAQGAERATFAAAISATPGLLVLDADFDSLLVHAAVEDDADDEDLRLLEARAHAAGGRA